MDILVSVFAVYQPNFFLLILIWPGPPYDSMPRERAPYSMFMYTIPSLLRFSIVAVSTLIFVINLRQTTHWRNSAALQSKRDDGQEKTVVLSIIFICTMFFVCFLPNGLVTMTTTVGKQFRLNDPCLKWLVNSAYCGTSFCQTTNSALNIFVYYSISSRYSEVFKSLFFPSRNSK